MIDTLRLRIPVDISTYAMITDKCIRYSRTSPDELGFRRDGYYKTLVVGSHRAKVNISVGKEDCVFVEFSVPKYWLGHNVLLFDLKDLPLVLDDLKNRLEDVFKIPKLPEYSEWRIQRLDICYAWKLHSNEDARLALATMKPYQLPHKDQVIYDTTVWHKGYTFSVRFYLKHEEFLQGDYKELTKWGDGPFAEDVLRMSDGVLRFEAELRKGKLDSLFKRDIYPKDIMDAGELQGLLRQFFVDLTKSSTASLMNLAKAARLINSSSTRRQAWEHWSFYRIYSSSNPVDQHMLKVLPKATYYAKVKKLRELGVGVYDQDSKLNFSFEIPSVYEVSNAVGQDE